MTATLIPCIDDTAYNDAATRQANAIKEEAILWGVIQFVMLLARRSIDNETTEKRFQLADRRMRMAEQALAHAMETWPYERALVNDTFDEPKHTPLYSGEISSVQSAVVAATTGAGKLLTDAARRLGASVSNCMLYRQQQSMAVIETDLIGNAMRVAEARALALNDRRVSRMVSVLALGRGRMQAALSMGELGGYGLKTVGDAITNTINSGMQLMGYENQRYRSSGSWSAQPSSIPVVVPTRQASYSIPVRDPAPAIVVNNYVAGSDAEWRPVAGE